MNIIKFYKNEYKNVFAIKCSIKRKYKTYNNFYIEHNFKIDKCVFCDNPAVTDIQLKECDEYWYIDEVSYTNNNRICKQNDCLCKKINPQSRLWLSKVKGLSDDEITIYLNKKVKKQETH